MTLRKTASLLLLTLGLSITTPAVAADDTETFVHAVQTFKAAGYAEAAKEFYDLASGPRGTTQQQSEFYLAECFYNLKFLQSALYFYGQIVKAGTAHPRYADALVGLVKVDEAIGDDALIPAILNREYDLASNVMGTDNFPHDVLMKINYIVGRVTYEKGKFDDAIAFLDTVSVDSTYYARAQYLKGVIYGRQGEPKAKDALLAFERVLALKTDKVKYLEFTDVRDLALLGAARVAYGMGDFAKSTKYYDEIPRFSTFWDNGLFENGWARFQNEDLGGAMGSLQALHAPQFEGSFQPESWILKATVYYYSCLFEEAKFALKSYEDIYLPMVDQVQPLLSGENDLEFFATTIRDAKSDKVPKAIRNYLLSNSRLTGFLNFLSQLEKERQAINDLTAWKSSPMSQELMQANDQQKQVLTQVTGKFVRDRLQSAVNDINGFKAQVAIIRFETTKKEKEVLKKNVDMTKALSEKSISRPTMPAEDWEYWNFQGEFWIDEIGYYQYTLKAGCPDDSAPAAP